MKVTDLKYCMAVFLLGVGANVPAQGWITFDNLGNNNLSTSATSGGRVFVGFPYHFGPWTPLNEDLNFELLAWTDTPQPVSLATWLLSDGSAKGICVGDGQFRDPAGRSFRVSNFVPLAGVMLEVRMWTGNYPSFNIAKSFGYLVADTGLFQNPVGSLATAPASLSGMPALLLGIPEPSVFSFAITGAVAFLLLRRRSWRQNEEGRERASSWY